VDTKISQPMSIVPSKEFLIEVDKDFELFVRSNLPIVTNDFLKSRRRLRVFSVSSYSESVLSLSSYITGNVQKILIIFQLNFIWQ
jgi:hypothetical protein